MFFQITGEYNVFIIPEVPCGLFTPVLFDFVSIYTVAANCTWGRSLLLLLDCITSTHAPSAEVWIIVTAFLWSVCLSARNLSCVSCAKMAELTEMPFGM